MDVDLSTNLHYLKPLIEGIACGFDISIGSRLMQGSRVKRRLHREIFSRIYNFLIMIGRHCVNLPSGMRKSILPMQLKITALMKKMNKKLEKQFNCLPRLVENLSSGWLLMAELLRMRRGDILLERRLR
ncbi:hypothetical protein ES705_42345 [subsurface metagenome]